MRYVIQFKGHYEENWYDFPSPNRRFTPSDSQYTVVAAASDSMYGVPLIFLAVGSQLDFRVQAVDGYLKNLTTDYGGPIGAAFIDDVYSSWSSVKTITMPGQASLSPSSQTNFPNQPISNSGNSPQQNPWQSHLIIILVTICIITIPIAIVIRIVRKLNFLNCPNV